MVVASLTSWNDPSGSCNVESLSCNFNGKLNNNETIRKFYFFFTQSSRIIFKSGLPKGILNVITGSSLTGQKLVKHRGTSAIYFTGSAETGKKISK